MSKLAAALLALLFLATALIAVVLFVGAYSNLRLGQMIALDALEGTRQNLAIAVDSTGVAHLPPDADVYLEKLKNAQKTVFDATSIPFLFQMLLLSLVSVGSYILGKTWLRLREAQELVKEADERREALGSSMVIALHYTRVHRMVMTLAQTWAGGGGGQGEGELVPMIRESYRKIEEHLQRLRAKKEGPEASMLRDVILGLAVESGRRLDGFPSDAAARARAGIADLAGWNQRCQELLTPEEE